MKSFNEWLVKPSPVYRELSSNMVDRMEHISKVIDNIRKFSDLYQASLHQACGELTIKLVINSVAGWKNETGLFDLIRLVDALKVYTSREYGSEDIIILEFKLMERN